MGGGNNNNNNFYEVLRLNKECSEAEVKNAYKKLALKWHPDRCSANSGNFKYVEESKKKFQAIQEAYSVLSNVDKRFMYDVGVYDSDDDDDNEGMADFMSEMAVMMSQNKPNGNGESFEELKDLFEEMFESDIDSFGSTSETRSSSNCDSSSNNNNNNNLFSSCGDQGSSSTTSNKRGSCAISSNTTTITTDQDFQGLISSLGKTGGRYDQERSGIRRKQGWHA